MCYFYIYIVSQSSPFMYYSREKSKEMAWKLLQYQPICMTVLFRNKASNILDNLYNRIEKTSG